MALLLIRELLMASKTFGIKTAARMAMTASTPIISINVKPWLRRLAAGFVVAEFSFIAVFVVCYFICFSAAGFRPQFSEVFNTDYSSQQFALLRHLLSRSFASISSVVLRAIRGETPGIRGKMALIG